MARVLFDEGGEVNKMPVYLEDGHVMEWHHDNDRLEYLRYVNEGAFPQRAGIMFFCFYGDHPHHQRWFSSRPVQR